MTDHMSPNSREAIGAIDSITKDFFYVEGTESTGAINVNIAGSVGTSDTNLTEVGGVAISLGQKIMTASLPVVLSSDQSAIPVSQSGTWNVGISAGSNVIGHVITDTGSTTAVTGTVTTSTAAPTTVYSGQTNVTTAGTQVALGSSQAVKSVVIKAKTSNTGLIYVGDSNVSSSDGFILSAGDTISIDIANIATVYIDSSVNAEGVSYLGSN